MKLTYVLAVAFAGIILVACNTSSNEGATGEKEEVQLASKEERLKEIQEIEESAKFAKGKAIAAEADRLQKHLIAYADGFPKDSLAPEMIFKAGNVCIGLKDYDMAIAYFNRAAKHYPDYIKRPEVVYMTAFVYDYHMKQFGKAREQYERVIEEYPNHVFAREAKQAIEVLGMSDAELIEKFKQQAAEQKES